MKTNYFTFLVNQYPPLASPLAAFYSSNSDGNSAGYGGIGGGAQRAGSISGASGVGASGLVTQPPVGSRLGHSAAVPTSASLLSAPPPAGGGTSTGSSSGYCPLSNQAYGRLSMSLEDNVFKCTGNSALSTSSSCSTSVVTSSSGCSAPVQLRSDMSGAGAVGSGGSVSGHNKLVTIYDARSNSPAAFGQQSYAPGNVLASEPITEEQLQELSLDKLKMVNRYAESTKSLSFLPMVHERQTARMKTRSEWFLNPSETSGGESEDEQHRQSSHATHSGFSLIGSGMLASSRLESVVGGSSSSSSSGRSKAIVRKSSSKEKRLVRRSSSSKKDKENGAAAISSLGPSNADGGCSPKFGVLLADSRLDDGFTETANYKPRI